ncbi:hypothetical protein FRC12_020477 [Ceratobasidium sp. 428]|nr:hypothetical protein FRC12_020477 [Ceratobasidium sp. 428]
MVGDSSTQDQSDASFFEQFCPLDSPVFGDDAQTPTASTSSGAPSPPLPLECPTPTYPQRTGLLHSWAADCEDLDAYRYAAGGIQAELDDYSTIFGMNGLATGRE